MSSKTPAFRVIDGHNLSVDSGHRTLDAARRAAAKRARALRRWQDAPHGGNRSATVWVEIWDASDRRVG